jgi:hypothetical protein
VYLHHQIALMGAVMVGVAESVDSFVVWGRETAPCIQNPRLFSLLFDDYISTLAIVRLNHAQGFLNSITIPVALYQKWRVSRIAASTRRVTGG